MITESLSNTCEDEDFGGHFPSLDNPFAIATGIQRIADFYK